MIEVLETIGYAAAPTAAVYGAACVRYGTARPLREMKRQRRAADAIMKDREADDAAEDLKNVKVGASKELAIPEDVKAPPVYEVWDHPAPPIPLLASSLPRAPMGYGWEITTLVSTPEGNPMLRLCLLDLKTTLEVESIEADLLIARRWKYANDETYAQFYRKAETLSAKTVIRREHDDGGRGYQNVYETDHQKALGKVMMANLITPMVDWARILVLRYIVENPDDTKTNYMLIQSPEEANE